MPPGGALTEMTADNGCCAWSCCICIASYLLLILVEILASLMLSGGQFLHSEMPPVTGTLTHIVAALHFCLLAPLVFLSFACLSLLVAAYRRDRTVAGLSVVLQAASWLFILIGLAGYVFVYQSCLSWEHTLPWFYVYVAVQVELVVSIYFTQVTRRKIPPNWEMGASFDAKKNS